MKHRRNQARVWFMTHLSDIGAVAVIIVVIVLMLIAVIAAIRDIPMLTDGTVVDKSFQTARTDVQPDHTTDSDGNTTMRWQPVHYPARWKIRIVGTLEDGEQRAEWWEVGEGLYQQIGIGDALHRDRELGIVRIVRKAVAEGE